MKKPKLTKEEQAYVAKVREANKAHAEKVQANRLRNLKRQAKRFSK